MEIKGSVVFVTGANRGFGRELAAQLVERGAAKVYAGARNPDSVDLPGVVPVRIDITDPESIAEAAALAADTTILINNAGLSTHADLLTGDFADIRLEMEVHYFGTLASTRAFVPVITGNGGGAILNVLSVLSWLHLPAYGPYSAGKAASWAASDALRQQLEPAGIAVTALHVGYMDTDMASYVPKENKADPAKVAALALDGIESGASEVLADDLTNQVKAGLSAS
jgi:NAD(P)-dependent dehydrogenase (short-subunit alcohol dehydrogenase family)